MKLSGKIDILVNNAGVPGFRGPSHEASSDDFDSIFAVNVRGPWLCTKYVVPHMIAAGAGSIVNTRRSPARCFTWRPRNLPM